MGRMAMIATKDCLDVMCEYGKHLGTERAELGFRFGRQRKKYRQ